MENNADCAAKHRAEIESVAKGKIYVGALSSINKDAQDIAETFWCANFHGCSNSEAQICITLPFTAQEIKRT